MSIDKDMSADKDDSKNLTPEEARSKLEQFLAITAENTRADEGTFDDIDSADSTMATLILPGG